MPNPHRIFSLILAVTLAMAAGQATAKADPAELLAETRINNTAALVTLRVGRHPRLSAVRIRSGSLPLRLTAVDVLYTDGTERRLKLEEALPPGHWSRSIPVDSGRPLNRIIISMQPGAHQGESMIQLLGISTAER